ncbi:MAG: hypothetical protein JWR38_4339 [Mucilaginibacter sp.]|nr:hypothetical protein [Mucilaginibacter sp.]
MDNQNLKKVWGIPLLLTIITVFGLLSALLGTGFWYILSWITLTIPLIVIVWEVWGYKTKP